MRIADKFEHFLETYRRADGRKWSGQDLHDATGGVVTRSYVSALRKGVIQNPGFEKLQAVAKSMGFPPELWFEDVRRLDAAPRVERADGIRSLADRLNHLFEVVKDASTGQYLGSADVARASLGDLTEQEVEDLRAGRIKSPSVDQVLALSEVFGVDPSYFLDRNEKPPLLDEEAMNALSDQKSSEILHKSTNLSDKEKDLVIDLIERLNDIHGSAERRG